MNTLKTELEKRNKAIAKVSDGTNRALEEYKKIWVFGDDDEIPLETSKQIYSLLMAIIENIALLKQYHIQLLSFIEGAKAVDSNLKFTFNPLCKHLDDIEEYTGNEHLNTDVLHTIQRDTLIYSDGYYLCNTDNRISEVAELVNT